MGSPAAEMQAMDSSENFHTGIQSFSGVSSKLCESL